MRFPRFLPMSLLLLAAVAAIPAPSLAAWSFTYTQNNPVCTASGTQMSPAIATDGDSGAIIAWVDYRLGNPNIYAQRIDKDGVLRWTTTGVPICTATGNQTQVELVADGNGGAILTWTDARSGPDLDLYAQRVDANGNALWTTDGNPLCTTSGTQALIVMAPDGANGAYIAWIDSRSGDYDIYAQRLNSLGQEQWTSSGLLICTAPFDQSSPSIAVSTTGNLFVTWDDERLGDNNSALRDIYAQKVTSAGDIQWTANGAVVCDFSDMQSEGVLVPDASGGCFAVWADGRPVSQYDLYMQHLDTSGTRLWTSSGVELSTQTVTEQEPVAVPDGAGGFFVTYQTFDSLPPDSISILAQRVGPSGNLIWSAPAQVCTASGTQEHPTLVSDGSGGIIVTWRDLRNGATDVFVQRVNAAGNILWSPNGTYVCVLPNHQDQVELVASGNGGALLTWWDSRLGGGPSSDIYASYVTPTGYVGQQTSASDWQLFN